MFESHAGILGPEQFRRFSLPYLEQIARKLKARLLEKKCPPVPLVSAECMGLNEVMVEKC